MPEGVDGANGLPCDPGTGITGLDRPGSKDEAGWVGAAGAPPPTAGFGIGFGFGFGVGFGLRGARESAGAKEYFGVKAR